MRNSAPKTYFKRHVGIISRGQWVSFMCEIKSDSWVNETG